MLFVWRENMTAWIGIIGVVIGGALTFLSGYIQQQRQIRRDRQKLLLSKLEEIHEVLSQYRLTYRGVMSEIIKGIPNDTPPEFKDLPHVPTEKLQMLVGFYASELREHLDLIEARRKEYAQLFFKTFGPENELGNTNQRAFAVLTEPSKMLDHACASMQAEVIALSKKYI
jgi:hypothetical protein